MDNIIEIKNVEIHEYCLLNTKTGEKEFFKNATTKGFKGSYFRDKKTFFALYPTDKGPRVYYAGREYQIRRSLDITLQKDGVKRKFIIKDYDIEIDYCESPYIGFDVWSDDIDVDLFYMITQRFRDDSFYNQFTLSASENRG